LVKRKRRAIRRTGGYGSRKKRRLLFSAIFIFIILLLISNSVFRIAQFKKFLTTPLAPNFEEIRKNISFWQTSEKINVACVCDPIVIASFEPLDKKINLIFLPADLYLEVPGYGWYPASSSYGLGQLKKPKQGGLLFSRSLASAVEGPIDYYIKFNDETFSHPSKERIFQLKQKLNGPTGLFFVIKNINWITKHMETNLTLFDLYRLWWEFKDVRNEKVNYLNIPTGSFEDLVLPDGRKVKVLGEQGLGAYAESFFSDQKILNEKVSVDILNGTAKEGVGSKVARIVEAAGADVVFIGNYQGVAKQSVLQVSKEKKKSMTAKKLSRLFNLRVEEKKEKELTDITLILGEDLSAFF